MYGVDDQAFIRFSIFRSLIYRSPAVPSLGTRSLLSVGERYRMVRRSVWIGCLGGLGRLSRRTSRGRGL